MWLCEEASHACLCHRLVQKSPSYFTILFSVCFSEWVFPSTLFYKSRIWFSASSNLLLIPSIVFVTSIIVFFISDLVFFMISVSFICLVLLFGVLIKFLKHFYNQCFELSCCLHFCLVLFQSCFLFLFLFPILSPQACFFDFLFCLQLCVCFYVFGRSATSVLTRWTYVVGVLWVPVAQSPWSFEPVVPGVSFMWFVSTLLLLLSLFTVDTSVGGIDPRGW